LNARDIPTREGKRWRFGQVAKMLHRPTYRGMHQWGGGATVNTAVPSLVSEETWYAAQAAVALNARASRGNSKRDYLLPNGCKDLIDTLYVQISQEPTVAQLAVLLNQRPVKLVADLFAFGIFATAQQKLNFETACKIAQKYGYIVRR